MYRKHRGKIHGDGPPKYKPPPPNKNKNTVNREVTIVRQDNPLSEVRPLQNDYINTQNAEPVTDLDAYFEDENVDEGREHYYSAAPSGWDDPGNAEVPPPYMQTGGEEDYIPAPSVNRGDSFISPAMFV